MSARARDGLRDFQARWQKGRQAKGWRKGAAQSLRVPATFARVQVSCLLCAPALPPRGGSCSCRRLTCCQRLLTVQVPAKEQPPASAAKGAGKMTNAVLGKQTEVCPGGSDATCACSALISCGSLLTSAALVPVA